MTLNTRFLIPMAVFQVIFGLTVFAITRHHYLAETTSLGAGPGAVPATAVQPAPPLQEHRIGDERPPSIPSAPSEGTVNTPAELSRLADEYFARKDYGRAAESYERLLQGGHADAKIYNNLGITLHYLGKSTEAIEVLTKGVSVDARYPRTWLTLGFINSQIGNKEGARSALTTAVELGGDTDVGQSAQQMLTALDAE